ncbi:MULTISPECIES: GDSL-type esterase/lipase family protein [Prauserella salsuginis group]|uniref:GDSL-type esterase/lipase family protein n=1 Tax=Prauserella salsuginis TaxID=387889 RepID=A0ABW6FXW8_9PSEU|nr:MULTISPECIES: GDSL-type esterase/lipase family protein [Prauserella salsuginis group]MCR3720111.1 GDSL-like Lipase/Acylhydrolase family protein [Prauserella flava]MCR3736343.1 GDSL-like Lipase/Acylhydrolase family protein [Prauserella salsuginis]
MTSGPVSVPLADELVLGALELERTERGVLPHRLPSWARGQCFDGQGEGAQLAQAEVQPAGVRLALRTSATSIELDVLRTRKVIRGVPSRPDGVYDLLVDGELTEQATAPGGDVIQVDMTTGQSHVERGNVGTLAFTGLPAGVKDVELWLPHNEQAELVDLRTDAPVEPVPRAGRRVWLHHGSSISQGSNAASASATWAALAAASGGVDLINLGYSGAMMLDPFAARVVRDTPADLISLEIGINLVNADAMRTRAFTPAVHGFLDTVRDGHPAKPLVVVSPLYCPIHEDTPGPGTFDVEALREGRIRFAATGDPSDVKAGRLTLTVVRDALRRIVEQRAAHDPNLFYVDGLDLYGPDDHDELPLSDALHPDGEAHHRIGQRFAKHLATA